MSWYVIKSACLSYNQTKLAVGLDVGNWDPGVLIVRGDCNDRRDVYAKSQGQGLEVKVTEVKTKFSRFQLWLQF